jgi:ribosomal protein S27E
MNDISDCPICLNTLQRDLSNNYINVAITSCGHIFCLYCIFQHSKKNVSCPLCRNEILDPNIFGIQNEEQIIGTDTDIHNEWIFASWADQLQEFNEGSFQMNSITGITTGFISFSSSQYSDNENSDN